MARTRKAIREERLDRLKDKAARLELAAARVRLEVGKVMADALDEGLLSRAECARRWRTSKSQVDRLVAEARKGE